MAKCQVIPKSMSFRVCVYPALYDKRYYTAHCLELDVIGQGKTIQASIAQLLEAIETQIEVCTQEGAELECWAPQFVWHKYEQSKKANRKIPDELMDRIIRNANKHLGHASSVQIDSLTVSNRQVMDECLALA